jgi:muramoyltetrapeptide carboxypeptidase
MSGVSDKKTGIAIIAPGGYAQDEAAFLRALSELESTYRVYNYYRHTARTTRFSASDADRLHQIYSAADNADVDVVIALRGGYGVSRLLPHLDFDRVAASGKCFVGHSDFTAFQMGLLSRSHAVSFAGPMICNDFSRDDKSRFTLDHFWRTLRGPACHVQWETDNSLSIDVSGMLWGGNLSMLLHLIGTPWLPQIENGILFVEDVNEHPYRVERMLLTLHYSGILARQRALLLGDFSAYALGDYDNGYNFDAMLTWLRAQVPIPILTGLPFGHIRDKVTLPVGGSAHLVAVDGRVLLDVDHYPTLAGRK